MDDIIEVMLSCGYSSIGRDDWIELKANGKVRENNIIMTIFPYHMGEWKVGVEIENINESSTTMWFSSKLEAKKYFDELVKKYNLKVKVNIWKR